MATHADIRIKFKVEGRRYEAVGFLRERERYAPGDEMLSRTSGENGGAIKGEDEKWFRERRAQLPEELDPYWLVTDKRHPEDSQRVSCFGREGHRWLWLDAYFGYCYLVVRRCA